MSNKELKCLKHKWDIVSGCMVCKEIIIKTLEQQLAERSEQCIQANCCIQEFEQKVNTLKQKIAEKDEILSEVRSNMLETIKEIKELRRELTKYQGDSEPERWTEKGDIIEDIREMQKRMRD